MDSLNFVQSVSSATHNRGHTLDLVLTRGFFVHICEIFDAGISDQLLLSVPHSRCKTKGDRAFSVVAPKLWQSTFEH